MAASTAGASATLSPLAMVHLLGCSVALDLPLLHEFASLAVEPRVTILRAEVDIPAGDLLRDEVSDTGQRFTLEESKYGLVYSVSGIGRFGISADGREVRYRLADDADSRDVEAMLLGPVIGHALQVQGDTLLHAGAVSNGRMAFAIAAPHGYGKSTLTSSFARCTSWSVLTDDILPIRNRERIPFAFPSHPRMKLWEDSAIALGLNPESLEPTTSMASKRRVVAGADLGTAALEAVPLRCLYILSPSSESGAPSCIRPLNGAEAALAVLRSLYSPLALSTVERLPGALQSAAYVAENVPVRTVSYYRSFENLPRIRETILKDFDEVTGA